MQWSHKQTAEFIVNPNLAIIYRLNCKRSSRIWIQVKRNPTEGQNDMQVSFESKGLWKIVDIQSNWINWQQMLKFSRVSDNFYLQSYPKKKTKVSGIHVKEWSQSISCGKHVIGQLEETKGLAQGIYQRKEQTENLRDLTTKDAQRVAEHTGIAGRSWYPKGHLIAQKGFRFRSRLPILFWKYTHAL